MLRHRPVLPRVVLNYCYVVAKQQSSASNSRSEVDNTARWMQRFGMFAGALVFPVALGILTYFDGHREIFRPEYKPQHQPNDSEEGVQAVSVQRAPSLGGPFTMRSAATTQLVTNEDVFNGRWTLLYFGFTHCAEVCPRSLEFLVAVMDECERRLGPKHPREARGLQTAFVTIDTVRDSPKEIMEFLSRFRGDRRGLVGLYGDDEQTQHIAHLWRVYFTSFSETPEEAAEREARGFRTLKEAIAADPKYQFDHSAAAYLVGPDGKLRDFFFKELGVEHAVERVALHWDDAYDLNGGEA